MLEHSTTPTLYGSLCCSDPNLTPFSPFFIIFLRLVAACVGALFAGPSMALIAYFCDFARGYDIAFIASPGVFAMIGFDRVVHEPGRLPGLPPQDEAAAG